MQEKRRKRKWKLRKKGQGGREGREGLDIGYKEQEKDGPDLRQGGRNEDSPDGCVARRQSPEDLEYCEWE